MCRVLYGRQETKRKEAVSLKRVNVVLIHGDSFCLVTVLFIVHNLQGSLKPLAYLNYTSVHSQT